MELNVLLVPMWIQIYCIQLKINLLTFWPSSYWFYKQLPLISSNHAYPIMRFEMDHLLG